MAQLTTGFFFCERHRYVLRNVGSADSWLVQCNYLNTDLLESFKQQRKANSRSGRVVPVMPSHRFCLETTRKALSRLTLFFLHSLSYYASVWVVSFRDAISSLILASINCQLPNFSPITNPKLNRLPTNRTTAVSTNLPDTFLVLPPTE